MTDLQPSQVHNLDDRYGSDLIPWSRPHDLLTGGALGADVPMFLGTVRPDGRPHSAGIGAVWFDGDLYLTTGPGTRKARNLDANPNATISVRLPGLDLTLEGIVQRVTDHETLTQVAGIYQSIGWPAEVEGEAFTAPYSAPSAGPPPWYLFRFTFLDAFGLGTAEPHGATHWHFDR